MEDGQAASVADLHIKGINRGFLCRLGARLLADLYRAINHNPLGFVFVAVDETGRVLGYTSGTTAVGRLYRSILLRRGWRYGAMIARHLFDWATLRGIVGCMFYPAKVGESYPEAELLSIVVCEEARGTDVAADLLTTLLGEFRARGCASVKLVVNATLTRANAFYLKHGFEQAGTILTHGMRSHVLVICPQRAVLKSNRSCVTDARAG